MINKNIRKKDYLKIITIAVLYSVFALKFKPQYFNNPVINVFIYYSSSTIEWLINNLRVPFALCLLYRFIAKEDKPSKITIMFAIYELFLMVGAIVNGDGNFAKWFNDEFIKIFGIALILENFKDDKDELIDSLFIFYLITISINFFFMLKYGTYGNENEFFWLDYRTAIPVQFMISIFVSSLYLNKGGNKIIGIYLCAISLISNFMCDCMTAELSIIYMLLIFALEFVMLRTNKKFIPLLIISVAILLATVVLDFLLPNGYFNVIKKLFLLLGRTDSMGERSIAQSIALQMFKENPVFGCGYNKSIYYISTRSFDHSHCKIIQTMINGGIFGCFSWILANISLIRNVDHKNNTFKKILFISVISAIYVMFMAEAYYNAYLFFVIYFFAYEID